MRWACLLAAAVLAACGDGDTASRPTPTPTPSPTATPTPTATERPAATSPWSAPQARRRTPLRCPASSSRAGWGSRVRALGGGDFVKLNGRRPRLAMVDADGRVLRRIELGARPTTYTRVLACGHRGRVAAAWLERRDEFMTLRLSMGGEARTVDTEHAPYDYGEMSGVALAFFPDGSLLVAYGVYREVRAAIVSPDGAIGAPFRLGPASEVTQIAAEIGRRGRAVVAWTTIDGGEERNERRRVYAVMREPGAAGFDRPQLVHRARFLDISEHSGDPRAEVRLAVAANGRALLIFGVVRSSEIDPGHSVRLSEAGPRGRFKASHRLAEAGAPGDVAIRSDGTALAVFRAGEYVWDEAELRAAVHLPGARFRGSEEIARGRLDSPTATFTGGGRPHVEWATPEGPRASTR